MLERLTGTSSSPPTSLVFPFTRTRPNRRTARRRSKCPHRTDGVPRLLGLVSAARVVLTDSGIQETTALGVPCLTVRDNTERPITITSGTNRLVGRDRDSGGVTDVLSSQIEPLARAVGWPGR